jgi:peptidyl-prolyl cis-trans isomerase C
MKRCGDERISAGLMGHFFFKGELLMHTKLRRYFWRSAITIILACISFHASASEKQASDGKAAVVNATVITQEDLDRELSVIQQRFLSEGKVLNESQILETKKRVLEGLINVELLYQEAQMQGAKVSDEDINKQLGNVKSRFPNEDEFKSSLSKMNLTETELITQIKRALTVQQFIDKKFVQKVTVSEKETKVYYDANQAAFKQPEQVKASHILIKVGPKADEPQKAAARKKIEEIQQRVKKGEDFAALAKELSEGPSSAKGGDLGYFRKGQMMKSFEEAAFTLKPGEVSDIVETSFGYHLIKLVDKKPERTIAYEDIKDKIQAYLKQKKVREQVDPYVTDLRGKAKIEQFLK